MKSAKDTIFEFVQQEIYTNPTNVHGVETKTIAASLNMHRSNVSALLNELVKEEKLIKTLTRPVYYQLPNQANQSCETSPFACIVGYNGSLRNAIQLAKAAILYPRSSLNVLICSKTGCGSSYFASLMFKYAIEKGVLKKDAAFVKINCKHYEKNVAAISDDLFGVNENLDYSAFAKAQKGMLFIDNFDLLDAKQQSRIFTFLETNKVFSENSAVSQVFENIFLVLACSPQNAAQINRRIPVTIELPELNTRPLEERFDLINHFFTIEGSNSDRSIEVTKEALQALLLYDFPFNIKELELQIKAACAKAYIRVVEDGKQDINICLSDFDSTIKKALLKLKDHFIDIENLLGKSEVIYYDKNKGYQENYGLDNEYEVYTEIKKQFDELSNRGISHTSVKNVIKTHIQNLFKKYSYYNAYDDQINLEQLSKIVDSEIIDLVKGWLGGCKKELGRNFKSNVFYGLCLHINSLLTLNTNQQRVDKQQIIKIIQNYPKEYAASVQLADLLKEFKDIQLPVEEIVLVTMFLIETDEGEEENHPVVLYIMHGASTASSLCDVTNSLTHCYNAYSYDLALDIQSKQAMEEIKHLILKINQGQGVLIIYDMGSIKTMVEAIAEEIDVKLRYMNIPITLIGIDVARKCSMETDLDYIYHMANLEVKNMYNIEEKRNDIIITLCHTGEGGAIQLKHYIDQYSKLGMKTIALSISARGDLLKEVMSLQKTYRIHAFVGTYDPRLFGVPFIPISKIFEKDKDVLDRILMFEPIESRSYDYTEVYSYLEEQLKYVSIPKLKMVLPDIIDELSFLYPLTEDQRMGLFMHLACLVERLQDGAKVVKNNEKNKILASFEEDYKAITKIVSSLEKTFKVIIDDNEIATLIMIIKKI